VPLSSKIVGHKTRRFRQDVDARWLMAYAAALGDSAPCYMDTTAGICAHPLFPVCLEWPVILDARHVEDNALTPEEAARGVHATHDLVIHKPLGVGAYVTESTIIGVEQRKPGAFQVTRLDTRDAEGALCATTHQGGLLRDVHVIDGDHHLETAPTVPTRAPDAATGPVFEVPVAAGLAHTYTECAHIWNPIHTDRAVALAAGLPDIILHGTATLALGVSALVNNVLEGEPNRVRRVAGRFTGMVSMPTTLSVRVFEQRDAGIFFDVCVDDKTVIRDGFLGV
jgi:acyl dehydratase